MTKEQKEQSKIEQAKAKEEFRQAKEELGDSLRLFLFFYRFPLLFYVLTVKYNERSDFLWH